MINILSFLEGTHCELMAVVVVDVVASRFLASSSLQRNPRLLA